MTIVSRRIEIPISPVRLSKKTRLMKSAWKTGVNSQERRLNGSAPGDAGTSGAGGDGGTTTEAASHAPTTSATSVRRRTFGSS
jgi:hypothetical protein